MNKLLRWLNLLLIIATFLCYLAPWINPKSIWFFSFFGMTYPWLLLFNLLFALFWLVTKKWYFLFSAGAIVLGWGHFQSFVGMNDNLPASEKEVKVMTFNVMGFWKIEESLTKDFLTFLEKESPDIICLQEARHTSSLLPKINYPYSFQPKDKNLMIFSRYPLREKKQLDFGNQSNGCIYATIEVQGTQLGIYNVHLQSNSVTGETSELREKVNLQEKSTWNNIRQILGKVKRAAGARAEQAKTVLKHLQTNQYPSIVCGDFNDTPVSYTYRLFKEQLKDGFAERAAGVGTTYDGVIPVLRIDYIWNSPQMEVRSHDIARVRFSDHFPVISRIGLPAPARHQN